MRKPALPLLLLGLSLCLGCASTYTTGQSEMFGHDYQLVYRAAEEAAREIGASIAASNFEAGVIGGRIPIETFGFAVDLDIRVVRTLGWGAEVSVVAVERGKRPEQIDPKTLEELKEIEDLYMDTVRSLLGRQQ